MLDIAKVVPALGCTSEFGGRIIAWEEQYMRKSFMFDAFSQDLSTLKGSLWLSIAATETNNDILFWRKVLDRQPPIRDLSSQQGVEERHYVFARLEFEAM
jgi:hypothetical protein